MERAQAFRALLRRYRALFSDPNVAPKRQEVFQTLEFLEISTDSLYTAFKDFVGITFNIKLMRAFSNLRNTLKECCSSPWPVSYNTLHTHLAVTFASLRDNLEIFNEKDVNTIRSAQNDETNVYTDITVISTFLSGVTASALQIVGPAMSGDSTLAVAVNTALFSSLVFSTASAAQSLLVISWLQSFARLPEQSLSVLLFAWLRRGPIISLLVAGALFVAGLVFYLYLSHQHPITSITTTFFALLQTVSIMCMTTLLIRDRWRFRREAGITGRKLTKYSLLFETIEDIEKKYKSALSGFPLLSRQASGIAGTHGLQAPSAHEQPEVGTTWTNDNNNDAQEEMNLARQLSNQFEFKQAPPLSFAAHARPAYSPYASFTVPQGAIKPTTDSYYGVAEGTSRPRISHGVREMGWVPPQGAGITLMTETAEGSTRTRSMSHGMQEIEHSNRPW